MLYGIFLHKLKKHDEAIAQYEKALKIAPTWAELHYNLGLALFEKEQYAQAKKHASVAYRSGYPLPGLMEMLKRVKHWP